MHQKRPRATVASSSPPSGKEKKHRSGLAQLIRSSKNEELDFTLERVSAKVRANFEECKRAASSSPEELLRALQSVAETLSRLRLQWRFDAKYDVAGISNSLSKRRVAELLWLAKARDAFWQFLQRCIRTAKRKYAQVAIDIYVEDIRLEGNITLAKHAENHIHDATSSIIQGTQHLQPDTSAFDALLEALLLVENASRALDLFLYIKRKYLEKYEDLRWLYAHSLLPAIQKIKVLSLDEQSNSHKTEDTNSVDNGVAVAARFYLALSILTSPHILEKQNDAVGRHWMSSEYDFGTLTEVDSYRVVFEACWLEFLSCATPKRLGRETYCLLLEELPETVLPSLSEPLRSVDFILAALKEDAGDFELKIEAIAAFFHLLTKGNMADPENFISNSENGSLDETTKVQSAATSNFFITMLDLIHPQLFTVPARKTVLPIILTCVQAPMIPVEVRAIFVKKLMEVAALVKLPHAIWSVGVALRGLHSCGSAGETLVRTPMVSPLDVPDNVDPFSESAQMQPSGAVNTAVPGTRRVDVWSIRALTDIQELVDESLATFLQRISLWEIPLLKSHWNTTIRDLAGTVEEFVDAIARKSPWITATDDFGMYSDVNMLGDAARRLIRVGHTKKIPPSLRTDSFQHLPIVDKLLSF